MIDGHNDLAWAMRELCNYDFDIADIGGRVDALHTDITRLREGQVTGQFWSVYVPSSMQGTAAVTATLEQIDFVYQMIERYPDTFALACSADEVERVRTSGRIASMIGMEGGHSIDESLGVLRQMYALGARYMTLTHNDNVPWADSATDEPVLGGLNEFGEEVVAEMNRLGMLVDLSHVSADVMRHAIRVTRSPVIFSHSSARALCDVARNVPDDVLHSLSVNGGLCMVTFVAEFVSQACTEWFSAAKGELASRGGNPNNWSEMTSFLQAWGAVNRPPLATIDQVADHIEHVRDLAGVAHVGIGGDYDGCPNLPTGLEDVSGYPKLFQALRTRSWSEAEIEQLKSGNVLRVMRESERVAAAS